MSAGLFGARTRVESVRAVGDRELRVVFDNGRTFSFWLPGRVFGGRHEAIEQLRSVELAAGSVARPEL